MNNNVEKIDLDRVDWKSSREFFESLGEALDKLDDKDESYNFTWVGKRKSIVEAGAPINKILRPDVKDSKNFNDTKNMLIVGDNLDALKLLQESYLGKIKMIYIDPPYNTGHDFVYHDNFTVKKADFKDDSTDSDGNVIVSEDEYVENSKANGRFHSDWLSMMYPRLKLARNLLTDDGVIFISIDDNEQANLKKICDEVFGEENFRNQLLVRRRIKSLNIQFADNGLSSFNVGYEFILVYAKTSSAVFNPIRMQKEESLSKKGSWNVFWSNADRPSMRYEILGFTPTSGQWRWKKELADQAVYNYKIYLNKYANKVSLDEYWRQTGQKLRFVRRISDGYGKNGGVQYYVGPSETSLRTSNWTDIEVSQIAKDYNLYFNNPKSINLITTLASTVSNKDFIALDFFAGSGTMSDSIMRLNAEDGGKRQYICVQLNEKTDEKSEARKAGYDTIDQITAERLRRAGEKIKSEHPEADIDTGFRVFRVDGNNENENIRKSPNKTNQSDMFNAIDNIKKDRSPLDLLFGVIYASALPFDLKLETRKIGENTVYLYGYLDEGTGLVACFDDNISEETFKEIAKLKALTAAFKDSSFTNSAAKINLSEHFRIICPDTKVKVL